MQVDDGRKGIIGIVLIDIRLVQRHAIYRHALSHDANGIAGNGDDALDIIDAGIVRIGKDDHIAALRSVKEVSRLVYKNIFIVMQRRLHTLPIHAIVLDSEAQHQEH